MKALTLLTNTEKGRLLIELFPEEKNPIITAMLTSCQYIKEHTEQVKKEWESGFLSFVFWCNLATEAEKTIHKYKYSVERSSRVFSDQLFYGHLAMFTIDCIVKYADKREANPKFQKMVNVLFS